MLLPAFCTQCEQSGRAMSFVVCVVHLLLKKSAFYYFMSVRIDLIMFKLVLTKEKSQEYMTCVPFHWKQNGILYWPKNKSKTNYMCVLLRHFSSCRRYNS